MYSFGVVLLELLTGRRAVYKGGGVEESLVDFARPYLRDRRKVYRVMDPRLEGQYPKKSAIAMAALAAQCITEDAKMRPRMAEVLADLELLQDRREVLTVAPDRSPPTRYSRLPPVLQPVPVGHGSPLR